MNRKDLNAAVQSALESYSQGATPSIARYSARVDTKGKPAGAYVATVKAIRKHDKEQAEAAHDAYRATGYQWAEKDNAINETRKAEAFAFAGASPEELALVADGVRAYYKARKDSLRSEGVMSGEGDARHTGTAKQFRIMDSRQDEKLCILGGFAALYDMARTGDDWEREASAACFEQLHTLGWNELVSACRSLRNCAKGDGLTVGEAKTISAGRKAVAKDKAKAESKLVKTPALVQQARDIAIALAQRGDVKGVDVAMLLRALGAVAPATVKAEKPAPVTTTPDQLRSRIKAALDQDAANKAGKASAMAQAMAHATKRRAA